jgi:hypothetical protein
MVQRERMSWRSDVAETSGWSTAAMAAAIGAAMVVGAAHQAQAGQSPAAVKAAVSQKSTAHPDLSGLWSFATLTPLERSKDAPDKEFLTEEEAAQIEHRTAQDRFVDRAPAAGNPGTYNKFWVDFGSQVVATRRTSLVVDPPDGRVPPLTPEAQKREDAMYARRQAAANPEDLPIWDRCIIGFNAGPPIIPSGYNNNLRLFQTADSVAILTEMVHDVRIVHLDGRPRLSPQLRQWRGDSHGRWEGDTLVIETENFTNKGTGTLPLDREFARPGLGGIASDRLHLTERFRRLDADTLVYEFTMNDPAIWTRPWTVSTTMRRSEEPIYEYACHEGNYGMFGILSRARAQEKATAAGPGKVEPQ